MFVTGDYDEADFYSCHLVWDEVAVAVNAPTLKVATNYNQFAIYGGAASQVPCALGQYEVAKAKGLLNPPKAAAAPAAPAAPDEGGLRVQASDKPTPESTMVERAMSEQASGGGGGGSPWLWLVLAGAGILGYSLLRGKTKAAKGDEA